MIISWENNKSGREVDLPCKNKWNWSWLEEKDVNVDFILDYIRKIDASGLASCIYFNKPVSYVRSCKKDKTKSMMPKCHLIISTIKKIIVKLIVYLVLGVNYPHYLNQLKSKESNLPYRIPENVHIFSNCPALQNKSNSIVSIIDCKYHLEAYFISFVVENSLLLSSVPKTN